MRHLLTRALTACAVPVLLLVGAAVAAPASADEPVGTGQITGTVTDPTGAPLAGASVRVIAIIDSSQQLVATAETDSSGSHVVQGLGTHAELFVQFLDHFGNYLAEYYDDSLTLQGATPVAVVDGQTTTLRGASLSAREMPVVKNIALPTISGSPRVGQSLTANPGTWDPLEVDLTYRWLIGRDADLDTAPTGPTYTPTKADVGRNVVLMVDASAPGHWTGFAFSEPVKIKTASRKG